MDLCVKAGACIHMREKVGVCVGLGVYVCMREKAGVWDVKIKVYTDARVLSKCVHAHMREGGELCVRR